MTLQGGALLPQTPLLRKRIFNSELPVRASGSTDPSLLHDLVEVRVDPSVSLWAAVQHRWQASDWAVGMNTIRAGGPALTAGSNELPASLCQVCILALGLSGFFCTCMCLQHLVFFHC